MVLIFFEGVAVGRPARGDTISEHVWGLRSGFLVWPTAVLWAWMSGHFWNPHEPDRAVWNDVLYLLVGLIVAAVNVAYLRRRTGRNRPPIVS